MGGPPLIDLNCENPRVKRSILVELDSFMAIQKEDGQTVKIANRIHTKSM